MADKRPPLRAGTAVLLTGVRDATLHGASGWVVPTEVLPNPSWDADRGSVRLAKETDNRNVHFVAVRPSALSLCCAGCWAPQGKGPAMKSCARCMGPRYCGAACQAADWTARHKAECKRLCSVREAPSGSDAPATDAPRNAAAHAFPWRLTLETPAMQSAQSLAPCFLTAHPNQRFICEMARTPQRPGLPLMPVLLEDFSAAGKDSKDYFDRVPLHFPWRTVLGVVGECVLTPHCVRSFTDHFDATPENRGALFRWPPAAAVWLDFATGESLAPGPETLLLVVQAIAGVADTHGLAGSVDSRALNVFQRVQPRLIRLSSLRRLVGGDAGVRLGVPPTPFYPDLVRHTTSRSGRWGGRGPMPAGVLWEIASDAPERIMAAFEEVMRDELKEINRPLGMDTALRPVQAQ